MTTTTSVGQPEIERRLGLESSKIIKDGASACDVAAAMRAVSMSIESRARSDCFGELCSQCAQIAAEHDRFLTAAATESRAKGELLKRVVSMVEPARESISVKVPHHDGFRGVEVAMRNGETLWLTSSVSPLLGYDFMVAGTYLHHKVVTDVVKDGWNVEEIIKSIIDAVVARSSSITSKKVTAERMLAKAKKLRALMDLVGDEA
jgi:hypothetical protein